MCKANMYPEWSKRRDGMVFNEKKKSRFVDLEWSVQICFSIQNLVIQNGSQQYFIQDRISLKELKNHIIMLLKRRETQAEKCLLTGQKGYLTIWNLCIYIYIKYVYHSIFCWLQADEQKVGVFPTWMFTGLFVA